MTEPGAGLWGHWGLASKTRWPEAMARVCWQPTPSPSLGLVGGVDADVGWTSGDRRRDTEEPGRQQVYYLSQSEGEDLASRPCRTRGCPRHEGTQGLRSLWVKRTELLRTGTGGHAGPAVGTQSQRRGGSSPTSWRAPCHQQGGRVGA